MPSRPFRTAVFCVALFAGFAATAQSQRIGSATPVAPPSAAARASFGLPNPAGLSSNAPAGLTAGSGGPVFGNPVLAATGGTRPGTTSSTVSNGDGTSTTTTSDMSGTVTTTTSTFNSVVTDSSVSSNSADGGSAGLAGNVARGPAQTTAMGSSGLNPVEVARSFIRADGNRDGELTRVEAQRLTIAGMSFEEMDRNFDGVVTRSEYEDAMR